MPTYPGQPELTVDILLKQPRLLARALTDLAAKRFVADKLFARGTPEMVAGGSARYQRSETIYPDREIEEVGVRSEFPRTGWSEEILTAVVHKYGLEVPISFESIRRNQMDQMARAQVKLSNALTKYVDGKAMALLLTDPDVGTFGATGDWSTAATDIIFDIAKARKAISDQDEGYEADTLVVNPAQELDLIADKDIRDALPREGGGPRPGVVTGNAAPILGLTQILVTPQLTAGKVIVCNSKVIGTIADEKPGPEEGYSSYQPTGGNFAPLFVKVYEDTERDTKIIRCMRLPAMWLAEPKAAVVLTAA